MPTPSLNDLANLESDGQIKLGKRIVASTGLPIAGGNPVSVDTSSNSQVTGLTPFTQTTITEGLMEFTGTGANDVMTQTLVGGADATTFTKSGFIRVKITDAGGQIVDGYHYIQVGLLT